MPEPKTKPTDADVYAFIHSFAQTEQRRSDSLELVKIFTELSGYKPYMWGPTIIGFGSYHYKSDKSRQEGDAPILGFSPRKSAISLYIYTGMPQHAYLLHDLGKFKMGKVCIYINKLSDINVEAMKALMQSSLLYIKEKYPTSPN
jgi:hypothetical protein